SALRQDLVTAGAVLGEQREALRDVTERRFRLGDRGAAEARDVGHERANLVVAEEERLPARLEADVTERHVARAEVEVRRERANTLQRRPDPALLFLRTAGPGAA